MRFSLWPMDYLAVCLISKCFNIFLLFYWFQFDSIMVIDCNPNDFISLKVVEVCFMAQNMACFSDCSMSLWKKCVFCCYWWRVTCTWIKSCRLTVLVQFSYILTNFLSSSSVSLCEWSIEVPTMMVNLLILLLSSYQFLLHVFWDSGFGVHTLRTVVSS